MQQIHSIGAPGFLPARIGNGPITMSSREIAELTGKRHDHVKRDIERMLTELGEDAPKFGDIYLDSMNREQTEYRLDRDLTENLLLGYSAPLRRKVLARLRELEAGQGLRLPTTAEAFASVFQMVADQERRQFAQQQELKVIEAKLDQVAQAHVILDKMPSDCESIVYIRKRMNKTYGLSEVIVDKVMRDTPYSPTIRALVKNQHVDADGAHYAGFAKKEVSAIFKRFIGECQMVSATMATHPFVEGRFKLTGKAGS
jgi:hypothetical protein